MSTGRREIFIKTEKKNTRVTRISFLQLSMVEIFLILDTPLKGQSQGVYISPRMILVQPKLQQSNQHRLRKRKPESNPN